MSEKYIIYIGGFNLPDKNAAAQRVIANAKIFEALGYKVTLIGLDKKYGEFSYEGFTCINLKYPERINEWANYLFCIDVYKPFIKALTPEIIVAYNHPACALSRLAVFCKSNEIKIISDCTEWYSPEGNMIQKTIKGWDTQKRMTEVHMKMDGIISISKYLHDYYLTRGMKSLLLPPLVDIQDSKWGGTTTREGDEIVLSYAGSPGHKDSLDRLVRIISELSLSKKICFEIIGLNKQQFITIYNFKNSIPPAIIFYGRMPHQETLNKLMKSDFQIFIREDNITTKAGFPTKFVESISAGVPVLTNLTSNIGDYLVDGINGFILNTSTDESLKSSLIYVVDMKKNEINKIKKSINRGLFDFREYIPKMKEFLESLKY